MSKGKNLSSEQLRWLCEGCLSNQPVRTIARTYSCSPATVSKVRHCLEGAGSTSLFQIVNMSDQALAEVYYGAGRAVSTHADLTVLRLNRRLEKKTDRLVLEPDYKLNVELYLDKKIKLQVLFAMYRERAAELGYKAICRSTFYGTMHNKINTALGPDVYMPQQHPYGHEVAIDYCGDVFEITNADGNTAKYAVCVLAWAASNLVYAEFIPGQTSLANCEAIAHALQRWQCAPRVLACDNAKSMGWGESRFLMSRFITTCRIWELASWLIIRASLQRKAMWSCPCALFRIEFSSACKLSRAHSILVRLTPC